MLTTSQNPLLKWIRIAIQKLHLFSNVISLGIELVTSRTESRDRGHSAMSNPKSYYSYFWQGFILRMVFTVAVRRTGEVINKADCKSPGT